MHPPPGSHRVPRMEVPELRPPHLLAAVACLLHDCPCISVTAAEECLCVFASRSVCHCSLSSSAPSSKLEVSLKSMSDSLRGSSTPGLASTWTRAPRRPTQTDGSATRPPLCLIAWPHVILWHAPHLASRGLTGTQDKIMSITLPPTHLSSKG